MQSQAHVATDKASRYMTQLAKHWSHKFEVTFDERQARIALPVGVCRMDAGPDTLTLTVETAEAENLDRMEKVVAEHLLRFMFREPETQVEWVRPAA